MTAAPHDGLMIGTDGLARCWWCAADPLYHAYHDEEWGVPLHGDHGWFEKITLEGAQAGLSWITILRRREGYRAAFDRFDPAVVAGYGEDKLAALLQDTRIVRNGAKIRSTVTNARAFMQVQAEFGSFDAYIWAFVDGRPILNTYASWRDVPARTPLSDAVSKDLKKHGFTFVGSTICYAIMQATGMVNDHLQGCHCRESASQRVRYA